MAQRPRLSQLKRTDINYRTFHEQYTDLEIETRHIKKPVDAKADLPLHDNRDGDEILVKSENVKYRWNADIQNWTPLLGKSYDVPTGVIKRYRGKAVASEGQTMVTLDHRYDVGMNTLDVFVQGVLQDPDIDYYEVDEVTIEFTSPLKAGMEITYMTPYIIGDNLNNADVIDRLKTIEYNHYQLMLNAYYSGKQVNGEGIIYDGFLNTNYIDYSKTSVNIRYDNINRTISLVLSTISKFQEVFNNKNNMSTSTDVLVKNSEITLPISNSYATVFEDDFLDSTKIQRNTGYLDITQGYVTTPNLPQSDYYELESKPILTNLPEVHYLLNASYEENGGYVEFYIKFNDEVWSKIDPGSYYSWINPYGAKESTIQLKAIFEIGVDPTANPKIHTWSIDIKPFLLSGLYESTPQILSLIDVTGGKIFTNQDIPTETSLSWTVQLDINDPEIPISVTGTFSAPSEYNNADAVLRARLSSNNPLLSPVVRDVTLHMHRVDAGHFESMMYEQIQEVKKARLWFTNTYTGDYVIPYLSRDNGVTWVQGTRSKYITASDGTVESEYEFIFDGAEAFRNQIKVKFEMSGAVEFKHYGIIINPM